MVLWSSLIAISFLRVIYLSIDIFFYSYDLMIFWYINLLREVRWKETYYWMEIVGRSMNLSSEGRSHSYNDFKILSLIIILNWGLCSWFFWSLFLIRCVRLWCFWCIFKARSKAIIRKLVHSDTFDLLFDRLLEILIIIARKGVKIWFHLLLLLCRN